MTEEQKEPAEEFEDIPEDPEAEEALDEVVRILDPQLGKNGKGKQTIFMNPIGLKKVYGKLRQGHYPEHALLRNEMLGLEIQLQSNHKTSDQLLKECIAGMVEAMNKTPTRIPLGIG